MNSGVRLRARVPILFFVLCLNLDASRTLAAADWPDGYVVYENTESPNGRYGILVPSMNAWEKDESTEETNYLANLKDHQLMGKIRGADYFEHQNHRGLQVVWAADTSWCVVEYDERFGFDSISVIELKDSSFVQTDIGKRIDKALAAANRKKSHDSEEGGGAATTYFRFGAGGKLRVRAVSTTDPKQISDKGGDYALFAGTFDLHSKKWQTADARALNQDEYDAENAFGDLDADLADISFPNEENKAEWLDKRMNAVYLAARLILPPTRFATLKHEQINWLKQRDAATSIDQKCKLIEARIRTLQELVW